MKNKFLFSVFVYFIILVLISLGSWQLYRLDWKLNLISEINNSLKNDPVELTKSNKKNYLRIKTSGTIDFDKQIYLYNLNDSGKPGFEVINPILIGNENYLINRGWIPFDKKDKKSKKYETGVSCPRCYDTLTNTQKSRFRMRQKQIMLAKKAGRKHIFQKEFK